MKDGHLEFLDKTGQFHRTGTIAFVRKRASYWEPPDAEPVMDLEELEAVLEYINWQFPNGWACKDSKIVPAQEV